MPDAHAHNDFGSPTPSGDIDPPRFPRAATTPRATPPAPPTAPPTAFNDDELPTTKLTRRASAPVAGVPPADVGPRDREKVPRLVLPRGEPTWLGLGDVAVHLLLLIDGETSLEGLIAQTRYAERDVTEAMAMLEREGLVHLC